MATAMQVDHEDIAQTLKTVAEKHKMRVVRVSWEDCQRSISAKGELSCWGNNISDVYIMDKKKRPIYTLRSENWNERLAVMSAPFLALVVGNESPSAHKALKSITLSQYLKSAGTYAGYAGVPSSTSLAHADMDAKVSVRFQAVFLPKEEKEDVEFTVAVYSYDTQTRADPQNLLLYCTSQGASLQQDGPGKEALYLHMNGSDGTVSSHWLKGIVSEFKVGQEQKETEASIKEAQEKGHATAQHIGVKQMKPRCNVVMLVQIPLKKKQQSRGGYMQSYYGGDMEGYYGSSKEGYCGGEESIGFGGSYSGASACSAQVSCSSPSIKRAKCAPPKQEGKSFVARVSLGSVEKTYKSGEKVIDSENWTRHPDQHPTVTITSYYMVENGVPTVQDMEAAIADINECYRHCGLEGNLDQLEPLGICSKKPPTFLAPQPPLWSFSAQSTEKTAFPQDVDA
jgi:hypothetical protein